VRILDDVGLSFDDVLLVPQKGTLLKREAADISTPFFAKGWHDQTLQIPILSAPMSSVTEAAMATAMRMIGGFGILHRFCTPEEQAAMYREVYFSCNKFQPVAGAALGVNEGYDRWEKLYEAGCRVFCLDIAHAHHDTVENFLTNAPKREDSYLIAGNVATFHGFMFLARLGVDAVKVGIGPGAACTTREVTGFGVPQLSAILSCAAARDSYELPNSTTPRQKRIHIIADGGIRNSGDIVKALAAGADSVMLGRLLAGADESPHPGLYWGMASKRVNSHRAPEGVEGAVPRTGPVEDTIKALAWGIKSGVSYGGGSNLTELRENAEFTRVTSLSMNESGIRV
jgi:IMP dehydrogenase